MPRIGPVAGFEQHGVEHPKLHYFAGHAVDFDPVAEADAVLAHQHEPAEEAQDEVLERNGEARARKAEKSPELARRPEDKQ